EPVTVISADARQVYRHLDIGTAKPDQATRARVPHLGLDLIAPGEHYSAGRFARDAAGWLADVRASGRQPVIVGGTGFYVRALAAAGLGRAPASRPAGALGGAARPAVRGRRAPAGGARRRSRAPHGTAARVVAGARARDRGIAGMVHSPHAAAWRVAAPHPRARGPDAHCRV